MALHSLRNNRLRSILTTLGIVIGVTSVILLVGLGSGVKSGFNQTFGPFASQININKVDGTALGGGSRNLTDSDALALRNLAAAPDITSVTPVVGGTATVTYDQRKYQGQVSGSTANFLEVANRDIMVGSMFTPAQDRAGAKVVLLGPEIASDLFAGKPASAIGAQIRIDRTNFKVIGVLTSDGQNDNATVMPLGAARSYLIGGDRLDLIIIRASDVNRLEAAEDEIRSILDIQHGIQEPSHRDYKLMAFQGQVTKIDQTLQFLSYFIVAIAGISLLVGGIGVTNIMLVSVTERTREIGIRKALGARRSAIMKQFLIEAVVLAGIGGLTGAVLGIASTLAAGKIISVIAPSFGVPTVSIVAVIVSTLCSLVIGFGAGGYPALRASKLRPIEALRYQ